MDRIVHALFALLFLGVVVLAASGTLSMGAIHLVLLYVLVSIVAFNQYDYHTNRGVSALLSVQVGLTLLLALAVAGHAAGGVGFSRIAELAGLVVVIFAVVLARDDRSEYLRGAFPYLAGYAVVLCMFLYHSRIFAPGTGLALFPVHAGVILGINLFVLPRYVDEDALLWLVAAVGAVVTLVGLPAVIVGEYSLWFLSVRPWDGGVSPWFVDRHVPIVRSIFANPNTLGLLVFPAAVAAFVRTHRALSRTTRPLIGLVAIGLVGTNAVGLYLSNSRASMLGAAVAIGIYATYALLGRRAVPVAMLAIGGALPVFLAAVHFSYLPIDPANRFTLWRASVEAIRAGPTLAGQGIVGTGEVIGPFVPEGASGHTPHNSYLALTIRAGLVGGVAYLGIVIGPLLHGMVRIDRVSVAMLALASGFAVNQLFEAYTLYDFGVGSVLGALAVGYLIHDLAIPPTRFYPLSNAASTAHPRSADGQGRQTRSRADRPGERE